jgi:hypothetical protein
VTADADLLGRLDLDQRLQAGMGHTGERRTRIGEGE